MFNPVKLMIDGCIFRLQAKFQQVYGYVKSDYAMLIEEVATKALETLMGCNALYHNVEHTILVTLVGQEILRSKYMTEGNVSREDWLQVIVALLCHDIGYVKGVCSQDKLSDRLYATGTERGYIFLPKGTTDASLMPYHVDRGKLFVEEQFSRRDLIDITTVQALIELTRFPVPTIPVYQETDNYPGLVRAADLIGQLSDPRYLQKIPALFYEFEEIGMNQSLGYHNPHDLRNGYPNFFWNVVYRYIQTGLQHLEVTVEGQQMIANLYANVWEVEREIALRSSQSSGNATSGLLSTTYRCES